MLVTSLSLTLHNGCVGLLLHSFLFSMCESLLIILKTFPDVLAHTMYTIPLSEVGAYSLCCFGFCLLFSRFSPFTSHLFTLVDELMYIHLVL